MVLLTQLSTENRRLVHLASEYRRLWCLVPCVITLALCSIGSADPPPPVASRDAFVADVLPFLDRYCIDCHMDGDAESGVVLDSFANAEDAMQADQLWFRIMDVVDGRVMPPTDSLQPNAGEIESLIKWIEDDFLAAKCDEDVPPSAIVIRRLNRQEYDNTIRDLIDLDLGLARDFPADDTGFGFDNIGSALNVSPTHIEKYLAAADQAARAAITLPDAESFAPQELIGLRTYPLAWGNAVEFQHQLAGGRYLVDFSLVRAGIDEDVPTPRMRVSFGSDQRMVDASRVQDETVVYRFWIHVSRGDTEVRVSFAPQQPDGAMSMNEKTASVSGDQRYGGNRGMHVDSMVVRGPIHLTEESLPTSHQQIIFQAPQFGSEVNGRQVTGQAVIERFARRAFRRSITNDDVEPLQRIFDQAISRGESFERAIQVSLTAILVSPQFLYLVEPEDTTKDRPLVEHELASRLSYFLWSTMPDQRLFEAADEGTLRKDLDQHVQRMLNDPKSESFVRNFVGQWLQLRDLESVAVDVDRFPSFDEELRRAMRRETEQFFGFVLRNDRSLLELLDSDYAFLNDQLARHYGVNSVQGSEIRKVPLNDRRRGGLLTQASILTLTSNPNRTSPVKRGKWILQQILGTPPPPPPPGVGELDESPAASASASLRERMEIHRSNPECAACHNQMDAMGFALENYDAIGRWRTLDGDSLIDPAGELPGGIRFDDAAGLKQALRQSAAKKFTRCFIENLMTYALGRSLESADYCAVESIRRQLESNDYRISTVLSGIIHSAAFQNRGVSR